MNDELDRMQKRAGELSRQLAEMERDGTTIDQAKWDKLTAERAELEAKIAAAIKGR